MEVDKREFFVTKMMRDPGTAREGGCGGVALKKTPIVCQLNCPNVRRPVPQGEKVWVCFLASEYKTKIKYSKPQSKSSFCS